MITKIIKTVVYLIGLCMMGYSAYMGFHIHGMIQKDNKQSVDSGGAALSYISLIMLALVGYFVMTYGDDFILHVISEFS